MPYISIPAGYSLACPEVTQNRGMYLMELKIRYDHYYLNHNDGYNLFLTWQL